MKISATSTDTLVTYSLGSCIGVAIYDPVVKVGGMLHYMLPDASINKDKGVKNPYMFANTGIPLLFKTCYQHGAEKKRLVVKVAGGGQIMDESGVFNIGKRNYAILRKMFWKNNILIDSEDIGGMVNRTMYLRLSDGQLMLKVSKKGLVEL
ncbi:MAG: chemotaxis protein CheD [Deltaproteobacteria bacterium]|nr:chemotaxis protein CheD [Candidatus Anaeroferrophillus wilburensis]MBN2889763.1 chemotaxis protein CheD [Deltaproteobacteria bacterium]